MKKIMGGLRRNRTSLTTTTTTNNNLQQDSSSPEEEEEVNYATLFDNDHDENYKENSVNSTQRTAKKISSSRMGSIKKRKKLPPQKLASAAAASSKRDVSSREVLPMMTISEMVEEDDELAADGSSSSGEEVMGVTTATSAEMKGEDEGEVAATMGGGEEDIHLLGQDREEMIKERHGGEDDATQNDQDLNEDCKVIQQHDHSSVAEEVEACNNNEVEHITDQNNVVRKEEKEQEAIDVHVVNKEVKVMIAAPSIAQDIESKCVGEEVSLSSSINEHFETNDGGSEEVIHHEEDGNSSSEEVTQQQQQQQQQQQVCHDNATQLGHHYDTHVKEKEGKTRSYLATRGLYTRSSYMESLRIKYQVV